MAMVAVNLIPDSVRRAYQRRRHMKRWAVAASASASLLVACLVIDWLERAEAADLYAQNSQLQGQLESVRADLQAVTQEAENVLSRITRAEALKSKRAWSSIFALVSSCMPSDAWLTSLATDPSRPSLRRDHSIAPKPKEGDEEPQAIMIDAPRKLRIFGYAVEAGHPHEFVTNLKRTDAFTRVTLARTQREPVFDGSYFRFELVCEW